MTPIQSISNKRESSQFPLGSWDLESKSSTIDSCRFHTPTAMCKMIPEHLILLDEQRLPKLPSENGDHASDSLSINSYRFFTPNEICKSVHDEKSMMPSKCIRPNKRKSTQSLPSSWQYLKALVE